MSALLHHKVKPFYRKAFGFFIFFLDYKVVVQQATTATLSRQYTNSEDKQFLTNSLEVIKHYGPPCLQARVIKPPSFIKEGLADLRRVTLESLYNVPAPLLYSSSRVSVDK